MRCLAPAATGSPSSRANAAADLALPRSGETTTMPDRSWLRKYPASSRSAFRWSTGTEKNPCTCGECSVMVSARRAEGLDEEHVPFPAVGLQLHFQAVVGEPLEPDREQRLAQLAADLGGQLRVGAAAEDGDLAHGGPPRLPVVGLVRR